MNQAERYMELAARTEGRQLDSSYDAAFYLLSCEQAVYDTAKHHVDSMGIRFDSLKRSLRGFDEISLQMVEVAYNLFKWTGKCQVTPFDISRMGYPYMEQVCNAICIASGMTEVQIHEAENGELNLVLYHAPFRETEYAHNLMEQVSAERQAEDPEWQEVTEYFSAGI